MLWELERLLGLAVGVVEVGLGPLLGVLDHQDFIFEAHDLAILVDQPLQLLLAFTGCRGFANLLHHLPADRPLSPRQLLAQEPQVGPVVHHLQSQVGQARVAVAVLCEICHERDTIL